MPDDTTKTAGLGCFLWVLGVVVTFAFWAGLIYVTVWAIGEML